ncbi:MAG: hypothetical protein E7666_03770 [Ruminococcaceae bacterium]|nr:hypothetical protein [Oscillospiraceae bacterium]
MLKGAQKQMIVIRTGDSRYFDEAYFVLRREVRTNGKTQGDMILEANRILRQSEPEKRRGKHSLWRGILLFFGGGILGAGIALLFACLLL